MGLTACTESQCLYSALYLYLYVLLFLYHPLGVITVCFMKLQITTITYLLTYSMVQSPS